MREGEHVLTLTHTSGTLVHVDGIWVEGLFSAAFEGASYVCDGDGNLVKSEVNGVVTYYLGRYYEKTVQNGHYAETCAECFFSKKHYSAGSSITAVRTIIDGTQDTLKSNSGQASNWLVAKHPVKGRRPPWKHEFGYGQCRGAVVSELRYSAFGEMRYLNGETVTDLLYTSQRNQDELGLYFYGARWYDDALGRFIQADSIVASAATAWAYDRYAYVGNNPIKYFDPSGHYGCKPGFDGGDCNLPKLGSASEYGVEFSDNVTVPERRIILLAVSRVAYNLHEELHENSKYSKAEVYKKVYGITDEKLQQFIKDLCVQCDGVGLYTNGPRNIEINYENAWFKQTASGGGHRIQYTTLRMNVHTVIHELGHAFRLRAGSDMVDKEIQAANLIVLHEGYAKYPNEPQYWEPNDWDLCASETMANQFLGWNYDTWDLVDDRGKDRKSFMDHWMPIWINNLIG